MRYFATRTATTHLPNGKSVRVLVGSTCSQATYNKYSKRIQETCFIPARNAPRSDKFSTEKFSFLVSAYLSGETDKVIVEQFYENFPSHQVNGGVACQLRIIAGYDTQNPMDKGLEHPSKLLVQVMDELAPGRFA